jgi:molybdopterin-guanine dinucleotide biosynthesis protein A
VVLAGGASRRLGGVPKGLEVVGGRRIVDAVADALRPVSSQLVLAANDARADEWLSGVTVVRDTYVGSGGLAGVEAALAANPDAPGALVVAWDMPFASSALLRLLLAGADAAHAALVVPQSDPPHGIEPFCAYYSASLRTALTAFLQAGGGAARDFVRQVETVHQIPIAEVARIGDPSRLFLSVNTPEDLERARSLADA